MRIQSRGLVITWMLFMDLSGSYHRTSMSLIMKKMKPSSIETTVFSTQSAGRYQYSPMTLGLSINVELKFLKIIEASDTALQ